MSNNNRSDDKDEAVSPLAIATIEALNRKGVKVEDPTSLPDLQSSLQKLQQELAGLAGEPTTPAQVLQYDEGLQTLAIQVTPEVQKNQAFLDTVKERGLQQEPAFARRVELAEEYLGILAGSKVTSYIEQVRLFLGLESVQRFSELREKLEQLAEQKLAFVTRNPRRRNEAAAVVVYETGGDIIYLPAQGSVISEGCWHYVIATRDRVKEAGTRYRASIGDQSEEFRKKATQGLNPWKALHEGAEGLIYLSTSFPETQQKTDEAGEVIIEAGGFVYEETGRDRNARMLIRVDRGNFTVEEVFDPDGIDFILEQSHYRRGGGIRWFPLDPEKFDPEKAPRAIREIVWPAIKTWQRNSEIFSKQEDLKPKVTVTEGLEGKTGHSFFHVPRAQTNGKGPAHLTCHVEWQEESFILQDYTSWVDPREGRSKGPLELGEIVGVAIPRQPAEDEAGVIKVLRNLLSQRREYETWKASQGEAAEDNNGAS